MNKNEEEQSDFAIWWIVHNQEKIIKEVQCCYVCDLPSVTDCMHLRNSGDGTRDWTRHHVKDKLLLKQKKRERETSHDHLSSQLPPTVNPWESHFTTNLNLQHLTVLELCKGFKNSRTTSSAKIKNGEET